MEYLLTIQGIIGRFTKLRREIVWILIGQALGFVGGFIGIKVLTNIMGPDGYGQLALGLTIAGLFNTYVYGPLANVVARFFVVCRERGELHVYFAILKKFHKILAAVVLVLTFLVSGVAGLFLGREWALIILLSSLYGVVNGVNASYLSLQSAIRQRKIVALHQGADVWLRIGLSIILLLLFSRSGYFALLGYLLGTFIVTVSQGVFALKNKEIQSNWYGAAIDAGNESSYSREFFGYAASFMIFAVFASISMYADRWILQGLFGVGVVGIYAAIYQIAASPVNMFFSMVNQLAVPIVFERAGAMTSASQAENSAKLVRLTVFLSTLVMALTTLILYFAGEALVKIITNAVFSKYHNLLWILVLGLSLFNIGQLLALKGLYCNSPKIYFWPKGIQALSLLAAGYVLTSCYGLPGMAWALCFSSAIYVGAVIVVNSRLKVEFVDCLEPL